MDMNELKIISVFLFHRQRCGSVKPEKVILLFLWGLVAARILLRTERKLLLVVSVRNRLGSSFS